MSANTRANIFKNTFYGKTKNSHTKAVSFLTDSKDKLQASSDPVIQAINVAFQPYFDAYINLNVAVGIAEGTYKGKTNLVETYFDGLKAKLRLWEPPVYAIFPEDSPTAIEIFPNKRTPYYTGPYDGRILVVKQLGDKLLEFTPTQPTLVPVQGDVAAYYALLKAARDSQQGKEGDTDSMRSQRDTQLKATMDAYWGLVWGGLLGRFFAEPNRLHDYVDLNILYGPYPLFYSAALTVLAGGNQIVIPTDIAEKLNPNMKAVFINDSDDPITLSVGFASPDDPAALITVEVPQGDRRTMNIAEAGWAPGRNSLKVNNPTVLTGLFRFEIKA